MTIPILLAGINGINAENALRRLIPMHSSVNEALIYLGAFLLVGVVSFISAILFRPQHHRRHSRRYGPKLARNMDFEGALRKLFPPHTYRRHRRHSEVFPLNPTLAEVGGLPPIRNKDQAPSTAWVPVDRRTNAAGA